MGNQCSCERNEDAFMQDEVKGRSSDTHQLRGPKAKAGHESDVHNKHDFGVGDGMDESNELIQFLQSSEKQHDGDQKNIYELRESNNDYESSFRESIRYNKDEENELRESKLNQMPIIENERIRLVAKKLESYIDQALEKHRVYELPNGSFYQGPVDDNGLKSGKGRQVWANETYYEGDFNQGRMEGQGFIIHTNGEYYIGHFEDNMANGKGEYYLFDGGHYKGEFRNDKPHGVGDLLFKDSTSYQGHFVDGKREGRGKLSSPNGDIYEGEFMDNLFNGRGISIIITIGTYVWNDKRTYEGEWLGNLMHGKGKYTWPDGKVYQGYYYQGVKQGKGLLIWPNGKSYEGDWKGGYQEGVGILKDKDKTILHSGRWERGKPVPN